MFLDYRYPAEGCWEAGSPYGAAGLAKLIHQLMNMRGVKVNGDYAGLPISRYDVKLDIGESVSICFRGDRAGSTLTISMFNKGKETDIFLEIWQHLTNEGYVFDERFVREVKPKEKEQTTVSTQNDGGQDKPNNEIKAIKDKFAYLWIRREFVRMKDYNLEQFLQENDAPSWLSPKALTRHMKLMHENGEIEKKGRLYVIKKK